MKIKLKINTYGKDRRHGENVYKVSGGVTLLAARGWRVKRRNQSYTYMEAPPGEGCKRPVIEVEVPTEEADVRTHVVNWRARTS